jgi:hypothetical protein
MKKRSLAILMILVLATAGLFAATMPTIGNGATPVNATLKATIGDYFYHGFVNDTTFPGTRTLTNPIVGSDFYATLAIENAFTTVTPFKYGYKTNSSAILFNLNMEVSNFLKDGETTKFVAVQKVALNDVDVTVPGTLISIFNFTSTAGLQSASKKIAIYPYMDFVTGAVDLAGNAIVATNTVNGSPDAGSYTSTITFTVSAS